MADDQGQAGPAVLDAGGEPHRLVAVTRPGPGAHPLRFHPRLTVLTGADPALAPWLAGVAGEARGGVAARPVGPADLRDALRRARQAALTTVEQAIGAVAASCDDLTRRNAVLTERLRDAEQTVRDLEHQAVALASRREAAGAPAGPLPPDPEPLERLLAACTAAARAPSPDAPEAAALAAEWEALTAPDAAERARDRLAAAARACARRVEEAERALRHAREAAPPATPTDLAESLRLRDAADHLAGSRLPRRRRRAETLRSRHATFLKRFGARSHDDLAQSGTGRAQTPGDAAIRAAAATLAGAERDLAAAREELARGADVGARRAAVRARATEVLGRDPGADVAGALREHRPDPPERAALAAALRDLGVAAGDDDPAAAARRWIASARARRAAEQEARAEHERLEREATHTTARLRRARDERAGLGRELERVATELEDFAFDRRRLEARRDELAAGAVRCDLAAVRPAEVEQLLPAAFAAAAGPRATTVVLDEPFVDLPPRTRRRALDALHRLSRHVQIVLVTRSDEVREWAAALPAGEALVEGGDPGVPGEPAG